MTTKDPGWELCRSFLAVLREVSLSGAARALGLTQPTVGRHVQELESSLGAVLFTRAQSGLRPTQVAYTLEPHAQNMAGAAAAAVRAISEKSSEARAVVRIAASEIMGAEVLPSILTDFRARHPRVIVELSLSDRVEDLLRRDPDIAVRMVRPKQGSLVARRIGRVTVGLHAHRHYLHESGQPNNVTELAQHVLIGFDRETASIRALQRLGLKLRRHDFAFRTDSHLAQLSAIRAGFGIGICQTVIARRDSNLVRGLPNDFAFDLEVWITMHQDLRATHPMRSISDYLAVALSDYVGGKKTPGR